jgi:hypothetical protein
MKILGKSKPPDINQKLFRTRKHKIIPSFFQTGIQPFKSFSPSDFSEKLSAGLHKRAWLENEIPTNPDIK